MLHHCTFVAVLAGGDTASFSRTITLTGTAQRRRPSVLWPRLPAARCAILVYAIAVLVLAYAAYVGSIASGALLLFLYGIGMSAPLLLLGTTVGAGMSRLPRGAWFERGTGVALLVFGLVLVWLA